MKTLSNSQLRYRYLRMERSYAVYLAKGKSISGKPIRPIGNVILPSCFLLWAVCGKTGIAMKDKHLSLPSMVLHAIWILNSFPNQLMRCATV